MEMEFLGKLIDACLTHSGKAKEVEKGKVQEEALKASLTRRACNASNARNLDISVESAQMLWSVTVVAKKGISGETALKVERSKGEEREIKEAMEAMDRSLREERAFGSCDGRKIKQWQHKTLCA